MVKSAKCFLVAICFIALGFILCRFALLYQSALSSKLRIYSYYVSGREIEIRQDGSTAKQIHWQTTAMAGRAKAQTDGTGITDKGQDNVTDKRQDIVTLTPVVDVLLVTPPPTSKPVVASTDNKFAVPTKAHSEKQLITTPVRVLTSKPEAATTKGKEEATSSTVKSEEATTLSGGIPLCSKEGEKLVGALAVDQSVPKTESDIDSVWNEKGWVEKGGAWRPTKCQAISKVAIIIPYRKRDQQLKIFLRHIHPMLKRQLLDYRIMVIEQADETPFNRAMLFNIGFNESLKLHDFQCFVFHDVDLIPEDDRNYYGCPNAPRHLSVAIDKFHYRLPYAAIFGGAGSFKKEHFEKINGFSNKFWGWGGEDDDLYKRIVAKNFKLTRPSMNIGRYKMVRIFHKSAKADPERFAKLRNSKQRMVHDGLNSLKYTVRKVDEHPLYTLVTVEVDPKQV